MLYKLTEPHFKENLIAAGLKPIEIILFSVVLYSSSRWPNSAEPAQKACFVVVY
jgi:hypothetical protein